MGTREVLHDVWGLHVCVVCIYGLTWVLCAVSCVWKCCLRVYCVWRVVVCDVCIGVVCWGSVCRCVMYGVVCVMGCCACGFRGCYVHGVLCMGIL